MKMRRKTMFNTNPDFADRIDAEANRVFDDVKRKYEEIKQK